MAAQHVTVTITEFYETLTDILVRTSANRNNFHQVRIQDCTNLFDAETAMPQVVNTLTEYFARICQIANALATLRGQHFISESTMREAITIFNVNLTLSNVTTLRNFRRD